MSVENKVVVITGASSGIGETTAKLLAKNGAKVVLGARRENRLQEISQDIKEAGGQAAYRVTDVTNPELSTIKVLGFYPFEVVMYIYRETLLLTIIGILGGYIGGYYLHNYIMQTLPPENAMAKLNLLWSNFTISGILTLIFSAIVMFLMARKINRVDMLEALKSVD